MDKYHSRCIEGLDVESKTPPAQLKLDEDDEPVAKALCCIEEIDLKQGWKAKLYHTYDLKRYWLLFKNGTLRFISQDFGKIKEMTFVLRRAVLPADVKKTKAEEISDALANVTFD